MVTKLTNCTHNHLFDPFCSQLSISNKFFSVVGLVSLVALGIITFGTGPLIIYGIYKTLFRYTSDRCNVESICKKIEVKYIKKDPTTSITTNQPNISPSGLSKKNADILKPIPVKIDPQIESELPPVVEREPLSAYGELLNTSINQGRYLPTRFNYFNFYDADKKLFLGGSTTFMKDCYGKGKIDKWLKIKEIKIEVKGIKFTINTKIEIDKLDPRNNSRGVCSGSSLLFISHYFNNKSKGFSDLEAAKSAAHLFTQKVPDEAEICQLFYRALEETAELQQIIFEVLLEGKICNVSTDELIARARRHRREILLKGGLGFAAQPLGIRLVKSIHTSLEQGKLFKKFDCLEEGAYLFSAGHHAMAFIKTTEGYFFDANSGTVKVTFENLKKLILSRALYYNFLSLQVDGLTKNNYTPSFKNNAYFFQFSPFP